MRKINLNELFCSLDLPSEELPEIHLNEDVSYKNVQKKVFEKIDSTEDSKPEAAKSNYKKHIIFGVGAAAALIIGGFTTYGVSNSAKNNRENTLATIDSSFDEIINNDLNDSKDGSEVLSGEYIPFSNGKDVYDYKVTDSMDGINVEEVKYCCEGNNTWILVHFKSELAEDISILETKFEYEYLDRIHFGNDIMSDVVMTKDSDEHNLYSAFGYLNNGVDPMENQYLLSFKNLLRKDAERITELGMKNLMGFKNSDISAKKEYTPEMKKRIADEFTKIGDYYYRNDDLLSIGELSIMVDMSEKELDIDKNIIPATIDMYRYNTEKWPAVSNTIDELKAEVVGVNNTDSLAGVLVKFTAKNGYVLDNEDLFKLEKAVPYTIDSKTGVKKYIDNESMTFDTYADLTGKTNNGIPCVYHRFEFASNDAENVYLDIDCDKLYNAETNSVISNGKIKMSIYCGDVSELKYISDSFTTDDGFDIDLAFDYDEIQMKWNGKNNNKFPDFIKNRKLSDKFYDLNVVMKNGFKCPVRMHILENDDGLVISSGSMMILSFKFDDISCIECGGKTIYTAKHK